MKFRVILALVSVMSSTWLASAQIDTQTSTGGGRALGQTRQNRPTSTRRNGNRQLERHDQ